MADDLVARLNHAIASNVNAYMDRRSLLREAAAEIARLRAEVARSAEMLAAAGRQWEAKWENDHKAAWREGVEAAAACAKAHRQELFSDGLAGDVHNLTKVEAFLAGCDQERDCIEASIRALKEPT